MATYMLRNLDPDLWQAFKEKAARDMRLSLREIMVGLMWRYVEEAMPPADSREWLIRQMRREDADNEGVRLYTSSDIDALLALVDTLRADVNRAERDARQAEAARDDIQRECDYWRDRWSVAENCTCDGGPQGEGLVSIPHEPHCPLAAGER